ATALEAAAPYLADLKSIIPSGAMEALPARPTVPQMILMEKETEPLWVIHQLKEAEQREAGSWQSFWKKLLQLTDSAAVKAQGQAVKTVDQAIRSIEDGLPLYDQLTTLAML